MKIIEKRLCEDWTPNSWEKDTWRLQQKTHTRKHRRICTYIKGKHAAHSPPNSHVRNALAARIVCDRCSAIVGHVALQLLLEDTAADSYMQGMRAEPWQYPIVMRNVRERAHTVSSTNSQWESHSVSPSIIALKFLGQSCTRGTSEDYNKEIFFFAFAGPQFAE